MFQRKRGFKKSGFGNGKTGGFTKKDKAALKERGIFSTRKLEKNRKAIFPHKPDEGVLSGKLIKRREK